jgi:molecular chaperone HtpG
VIKKIAESDDADYVNDMAQVVLDQALLNEGVMLKNPAEFVKRLTTLLSR